MLRGGYLLLGSPPRLRLHVALPAGAVLFSGLSLSPGAWAGFASILLARALFQALASLALGLGVQGLDLHPLGSRARPRLAPGRLAASAVAIAGLSAQLAALAFAALHRSPPSSPFLAQLVASLLWPNAALLAVNLLPLRGLDGFALFRFREEAPALAGGPQHEATGLAPGDRPPAPPLAAPPPARPLLGEPPRRSSHWPRPPSLHPGDGPPDRFAVEDGDPPPMPDHLRHEVSRIIEDALREGAKERRSKGDS